MGNIKILFIGDIVARAGRTAVESFLPSFKQEQSIDLVVANAENLAGGKGVTEETLYQMQNAGVDYFTSGNHIFSQENWEQILDASSYGVLRPANYLPETIPGVGVITVDVGDHKVAIVNLEGSERMGSPVENPFYAVEEVLSEIEDEVDIILVDFHAELTSEKRAFGFHLDGRVTAVLGTHTHVPSADLQVLPNGTLYVTDLGMTGAKDSVLGVKKEIVINRFMSAKKERFEWSRKGEKVFNAVVFEVGSDGQIGDFSRVDRIIP